MGEARRMSVGAEGGVAGGRRQSLSDSRRRASLTSRGAERRGSFVGVGEADGRLDASPEPTGFLTVPGSGGGISAGSAERGLSPPMTPGGTSLKKQTSLVRQKSLVAGGVGGGGGLMGMGAGSLAGVIPRPEDEGPTAGQRDGLVTS
ncbi:hypothetical protein HK097_000471, partial [Rhizophlyctis rosea]